LARPRATGCPGRPPCPRRANSHLERIRNIQEPATTAPTQRHRARTGPGPAREQNPALVSVRTGDGARAGAGRSGGPRRTSCASDGGRLGPARGQAGRNGPSYATRAPGCRSTRSSGAASCKAVRRVPGIPVQAGPRATWVVACSRMAGRLEEGIHAKRHGPAPLAAPGRRGGACTVAGGHPGHAGAECERTRRHEDRGNTPCTTTGVRPDRTAGIREPTRRHENRSNTPCTVTGVRPGRTTGARQRARPHEDRSNTPCTVTGGRADRAAGGRERTRRRENFGKTPCTMTRARPDRTAGTREPTRRHEERGNTPCTISGRRPDRTADTREPTRRHEDRGKTHAP
jgi:hypothetical protein